MQKNIVLDSSNVTIRRRKHLTTMNDICSEGSTKTKKDDSIPNNNNNDDLWNRVTDEIFLEAEKQRKSFLNGRNKSLPLVEEDITVIMDIEEPTLYNDQSTVQDINCSGEYRKERDFKSFKKNLKSNLCLYRPSMINVFPKIKGRTNFYDALNTNIDEEENSICLMTCENSVMEKYSSEVSSENNLSFRDNDSNAQAEVEAEAIVTSSEGGTMSETDDSFEYGADDWWNRVSDESFLETEKQCNLLSMKEVATKCSSIIEESNIPSVNSSYECKEISNSSFLRTKLMDDEKIISKIQSNVCAYRPSMVNVFPMARQRGFYDRLETTLPPNKEAIMKCGNESDISDDS